MRPSSPVLREPSVAALLLGLALCLQLGGGPAVRSLVAAAGDSSAHDCCCSRPDAAAHQCDCRICARLAAPAEDHEADETSFPRLRPSACNDDDEGRPLLWAMPRGLLPLALDAPKIPETQPNPHATPPVLASRPAPLPSHPPPV